MSGQGRFRKGAYLALATALISGVSVYVNAFGVRQVPDPFVFTTAKNLLVATMLAALILLPLSLGSLRRLSGRDWAKLALLGLVGGSVPFLLFFYGLSQATAPSAAFMHKTLFLWVALLAVPFLQERLGRVQLVALLVLAVGNLVLVGRPTRWTLGQAELLTLVATLFWAVEAILARRFLQGGFAAPVAALGRMGFGAIAMFAFLATTGRGGTLVTLNVVQWGWVVLTAVFLLGYVVAYYSAFKYAPATLVTSVLVLGSVLTSLLHAIFSARTYSPAQVAGFVLVVLAAALWVWIGHRLTGQATVMRGLAYARR
ncbi:MAG: hypothetical protein CL878_08355 [Dehalococcoidia bacterium]|nr:hypothetical protein [Dehalococcoidia bacterium]